MSVPAVAVAGALFVIARSATRCAVVVAVAALFVALVSSVALEAVTVAVFAIGPVAAGLMWTLFVTGGAAPAGRGPNAQLRGRVVLVQPARAEKNPPGAGST